MPCPEKPPQPGGAQRVGGGCTSITLMGFGGAEPLPGAQRGFATSRDPRDAFQRDGDCLVLHEPLG